MFIDPPPLTATVEEWEDFIAELKTLPQTDDVLRELADAELIVTSRKRAL